MKTKIIDNFPTWALCAVVNDDRTALSEDDEQILDKWMEETREELHVSWMDICPIYGREGAIEEHFSSYPCFGLATNVCEVHIICQ